MKPGERGDVRFKEHDVAKRCVQFGSGAWSESERVLASQTSFRQSVDNRTPCTYPDSIIARILGKKGEHITEMRKRSGAQKLNLRGKDLGEDSTSQRLHFVLEGDQNAI